MLLIDLPLIEYGRAIVVQKTILERKVASGGPDVLLVLEHPPTVTLGIRGKRSDLLVPEERLREAGIGLFSVDRGGEATYHGPGQVICYPIVDLRSLGITVRAYVRRLEETIISALGVFDVTGFRQEGKIGVWTAPKDKIASIGIRISRRIAYHGFSVNVELQANPSEFIVSCGMPEARMVSLNDLVPRRIAREDAKAAIAKSFADEFRVELEPGSLEQVIS
ncbi:MAG: lipoyl(octanoyl) transferase LipB [Desulfomonile tiedjei]|uniref:Octanoyltransferase n=1 Tax=Desulfomonile tiedjei TaxID=2358 RepID=A0A9D6V083_9BACT|nr:lipoyl(octanoyl) transferase LipB [Desulfomonile tiedjei]